MIFLESNFRSEVTSTDYRLRQLLG